MVFRSLSGGVYPIGFAAAIEEDAELALAEEDAELAMAEDHDAEIAAVRRDGELAAAADPALDAILGVVFGPSDWDAHAKRHPKPVQKPAVAPKPKLVQKPAVVGESESGPSAELAEALARRRAVADLGCV